MILHLYRVNGTIPVVHRAYVINTQTYYIEGLHVNLYIHNLVCLYL